MAIGPEGCANERCLNMMTESFEKLFEESLASQPIKPGTILTGNVIEINEDVVIVNAGLKSEAVIPITQFFDDKGELEVSVGDDIEVAVDSVEDGFGETRLSRENSMSSSSFSSRVRTPTAPTTRDVICSSSRS